MSTRTNIDLVKAVIETQLEDTQITALMTQANSVVTSKLDGEGLTAAVLENIETWFTAHLIAVAKERQPQEEKVGDIWLIYQERPTDFLRSTTYGEMVLFLDTKGLMAQASKGQVRIRAIKQIND